MSSPTSFVAVLMVSHTNMPVFNKQHQLLAYSSNARSRADLAANKTPKRSVQLISNYDGGEVGG